MKKIIALILAVVCLFALVACSESEADKQLAVYIDAISKTSPSAAVINTTYTDANFGVSLGGAYNVTYNDDGTATVAYEYDKLGQIGEEFMSTVSGTVTIKEDGTVDGTIDTAVQAAAEIKLNLKASEIAQFTVAKGILTAIIKADKTESVLGVDLGADASLMMVVTNDGKIGTVSVVYTDEGGTSSIVCMYINK